MRFHDTVGDILGSKIKIGILRLLFQTRGLFSGREISRLVGFSPTHTIANLRELEATGLVLRQRAGNTDLYQLNDRNSAIYGVLSPIFEWESNLLSELTRMYADKLGKELVSVRLFGSAARGEEELDSDIDLLLTLDDGVAVDKLEEAVAEVDLEAGQRFGCPISSVVVTESEYAMKVKSRRGFWQDIANESKVIYERTG
jgi:predicted nucleotidyltransferase